jgi:putative transposase
MSNWPHSPLHDIMELGTYMVTAGTYGKFSHFSTPERLDYLLDKLLTYAERYEWRLQAWAVMSNHYHFIGFCATPENLKDFISTLHTDTARYINDLDKTKTRRVWYQYWDSHITYQKSYYPRLKYVHNNPVHHGVVPVAENYNWCSAGWFNKHAVPAFRRTIESFKIDNLKVFDDF